MKLISVILVTTNLAVPLPTLADGEKPSGDQQIPEHQVVSSDPVDITGEWAVTWIDPRNKYRETFFMVVSQTDGQITGTALDPNLIPASISGTVESDQVMFFCGPARSTAPYHVPPTSTFRGRIADKTSMTGSWQVNKKRHRFARREKGTWVALRTGSEAEPTTRVTSDTRLTLPLTSEEYDLLFTREFSEPTRFDKEKEAHRADSHYEPEISVDMLLYHHRQLGDMIRIKSFPPAGDTVGYLQLQKKIEALLDTNGYPWSLDTSSRTVKALDPMNGVTPKKALAVVSDVTGLRFRKDTQVVGYLHGPDEWLLKIVLDDAQLLELITDSGLEPAANFPEAISGGDLTANATWWRPRPKTTIAAYEGTMEGKRGRHNRTVMVVDSGRGGHKTIYLYCTCD